MHKIPSNAAESAAHHRGARQSLRKTSNVPGPWLTHSTHIPKNSLRVFHSNTRPQSHSASESVSPSYSPSEHSASGLFSSTSEAYEVYELGVDGRDDPRRERQLEFPLELVVRHPTPPEHFPEEAVALDTTNRRRSTSPRVNGRISRLKATRSAWSINDKVSRIATS
uniref:Uncharacterized protein n=1 Tax=Mycena chlorophos TaxID=658473 RepID=A0ABQ0L9C8_MYCCL|nr:predicted protein [Mycena chlorophos]